MSSATALAPASEISSMILARRLPGPRPAAEGFEAAVVDVQMHQLVGRRGHVELAGARPQVVEEPLGSGEPAEELETQDDPGQRDAPAARCGRAVAVRSGSWGIVVANGGEEVKREAAHE